MKASRRLQVTTEPRRLHTVSAVIEALGGTHAAARRVNCSPQSVSNWRSEGRMAAKTFVIFGDELERQNLVAASELWGIPRTRPMKKLKKKSKAASS